MHNKAKNESEFMSYNIINFGAKGDGTLCTKQIQNAIDYCFLAGGGEVVVPNGRFLVAGLRLRSNVTLHLLEGATLAGSTNPEDYFEYLNDEIEPISEQECAKTVPTAMPQAQGSRSVMPFSRWNNAIIRAVRAKNIAIIGEKDSFIDGQDCYDEQGEENYRGPHAINMWYCENIRFSGYTIVNSGNWAHAIQNSRQIYAKTITVLGGHDGFDVRTCDDIVVEDCVFRTGDDAIAGFDNINVVVRNSVLNTSCSALRFGGRDVLVENCTTEAPNTYGFRGNLTPEQKKARAKVDESCRYNCLNVFLYYCDYRAKIRKPPGNILIRNCSFKNVDAVFSQSYGHVWSCNKALDNIIFENCLFDGVCQPIHIDCPEDEPLTFIMKNCKLSARDGAGDKTIAEARNFRDIVFENVDISGYDNAKIVYCTEGNMDLKASTPITCEKSNKLTRGGQ